MRGDAVLIRLSAPPVEGAANDALVAFLADTLDLPRRNIRIVSGLKSRDKVVEVEGVTIDAALQSLTGSRGHGGTRSRRHEDP